MSLGSSPTAESVADKPAADTVQVVIRTPALAEVRIVHGGDHPATIGTVRLTHDSWCWEHNDGEQSSPIAPTRLAAAKALAEKGVTPPGVDLAHQRVRSASLVLPPDLAFKDAAREALTARTGMAPASV